MPMYNLIECSKNYIATTVGLWNYYKDEPNSNLDDNYNANFITNSVSFKYKSSIKGKTPNNGNVNDDNNTKDDIQIVVPLKYLSNFWRTLNMSFINCEINLILTFENCESLKIVFQLI